MLDAVGGAPGETEMREEYMMAGLPVMQPTIKDVEVGIMLVWRAFKQGRLLIVEGNDMLQKEIETYSRKPNEEGNATAAIQDKNSFHLADSLRYVLTEARYYLFPSEDNEHQGYNYKSPYDQRQEPPSRRIHAQ